MKSFLESRWCVVLAATPFLILEGVHRYLGLSDALMVSTPPGEREAHLFNWIMVLAASVGNGAFILRACLLSREGAPRFLARVLSFILFWEAVSRWM